MAKCTKKVGIVGKYTTRYGASLRKTVKKTEISQQAKNTCSFCEFIEKRGSGDQHRSKVKGPKLNPSQLYYTSSCE
uniref:60S ribosomal protein L37a n=1 Tax=Capra hircus TaxID=9925 RepID=A0A8C2XWP0_CAPHI